MLGLSLSSSWGNGHATTWRGLLKALAARGHDILFLERDKPWYAAHRDLADPDYCALAFYDDLAGLAGWAAAIRAADLVVIGSYVPDGIAVARQVRPWARFLAFYDIDTPVTLARLRDGDCDYLDAASIAAFDLYLSFTGGPTLDLLERRYHSPAARALFCAADPAMYCPPATRRPPRWDLGYLGTYSADRQPALERLLLEPARQAPGRRFVVAGPQYPAGIAWPANVERIDHLPPAGHAAFYGDLGWALNVTRADMLEAGHSPSVRLFEAAACGAAILSDAWAGVEEAFAPGSEIVIVGGTTDVLACLRRPAGERLAIGAAARARFLRCHTAAHRAATLEGYVERLACAAL